MEMDDIPQVGRIFFKVFRKKPIESPEEFNRYFKELFFTSPSYSRENGSIVHEGPDGRIDSVISVIPMQYSVVGRPVTARLLCTFMVDPAAAPRGPAKLTLAFRRQDFCFTDSASPVSADHFKAVGGVELPMQGLEWRRTFRPAALLAHRSSQRIPLLGRLPAGPLASPLDGIARRMVSTLCVEAPPGVHDEAMTQDAFLSHAPTFLTDYSVHPVWSRPELEWIMRVAALNDKWGAPQIRAVFDRSDKLCGCFIYFGRPGSVAHVLNVLPARGMERAVIGRMLHHLDKAGYIAAEGRVQPRLLNALSRHRAMVYRHKAHVCVSTPRAEIREAIERNDIYIGGLAGESWSRLMSDFQ
ncbi:GNAT family N-acetyltransferase [Phyllobacterium phragmitis]|uniref:GNAT family N-acetyltransferase n=2 Tax=Phyllobacterium phragmitis TaxID=2670329 RepID=A0A2S9IUX1_9HYPH|nr:GNAT family N-acetyltransferase [Phyllobacterium phragmitis]